MPWKCAARHRPEAGHCDIFSVAGTNDHITPWQSCYRSAHLFGGKIEFVLSNSGHIQSILNPPGNPKARFMTGEDRPATRWPGRKTRPSTPTPGGCTGRLAGRARRRTEKGADPPGQPCLRAGEAAPGTYVHER
jgi:polyhydroxyalkanoate synthase